MVSETKIKDEDWYEFHQKVQSHKVAEAFRLFENEAIEPILIKGFAVARLYPPDKLRPFADIDLCVAPDNFQKASKLLKSKQAGRLNIDLHSGLRHLDTLGWEDLFENSKIIKVENQNVRVLRAEDHLRVLCVHWLTDGGADREKLWDIFYTFKSEGKKFDWVRCLESVGSNRRRWIICTIGLAEKYFHIPLGGTPFANKSIQLPEWLTKAVEKEWKSPVKLKPLQTCLRNRKELFRQIKKRIPPNSIQATVECEGSFDKKTIVFYQIENFFTRSFPSFGRIRKVLFK